MQNRIDNYFISLPEPERSCLLFLRNFILEFSTKITEKRKFNTPFYYSEGRWLCYISYHPKTRKIHISFVNGFKISHPKLFAEGRKKMKIFHINAHENIDIKSLKKILWSALEVT